MEIITKVNGVDVPVEITEETVNQISKSCADEMVFDFIDSMTYSIIEYVSESEDEELDEYEELELHGKIMRELQDLQNANPNEFGHYIFRNIADGYIVEKATEWLNEIIENRAKFYSIKVDLTSTYEVIVKSKSLDDAIDYVENMYVNEIIDQYECIDECREFYVIEQDSEETDFDGCGNYEDITE